MRRPRFPLPLREKIKRNIASLRVQGIEPTPSMLAMAEELSPPAPKKRIPRIDSPDKPPLERDVQSEIIAALEQHPRVAKVIRFNNGAAMHQKADGSVAFVEFSSELVVDLYVILFEGRYAWLECKRPGWRQHVGEYNPNNRTLAREATQAKFLLEVRNAGGIGAFVRSVDEALDAIK